jgi:hypothetical protein
LEAIRRVATTVSASISALSPPLESAGTLRVESNGLISLGACFTHELPIEREVSSSHQGNEERRMRQKASSVNSTTATT